MNPAEFEEKDFEGPLYTQLLQGSNRFATPGQVFENAFGVDAILEAQNAHFFELFGRRNIPAGILLNDFRWGQNWRRYAAQRTLPSFPVNLLIQAKRPDFLAGRRGDFAALGINGSYWRFHIMPHQHAILHQLERRIHHRAIVVYAAPAFHTLERLYLHTENRDMVENSSFVTPSKITGHHSWNFNQPGSRRIAASKPEYVFEKSFIEKLADLLEQHPKSEAFDDLTLIDEAIMAVSKETTSNPITAYFNKLIEKYSGAAPEQRTRRRTRALKTYERINLFFNLVGVRWLAYGK